MLKQRKKSLRKNSMESMGCLIGTGFVLAFSVPGILLTIGVALSNYRISSTLDWIETEATPFTSDNYKIDTRLCYLYAFVVCLITLVWTAFLLVQVDDPHKEIATIVSTNYLL